MEKPIRIVLFIIIYLLGYTIFVGASITKDVNKALQKKEEYYEKYRTNKNFNMGSKR